jgi:hypothetical protein
VIKNAVNNAIKNRASRMAERLLPLCDEMPDGHKFMIGGGCLSADTIRDIDIFRLTGRAVWLPSDKWQLLSNTKNARTIRVGSQVVQLCTYKQPTVEALADSFDYAHIQATAAIKKESSGFSVCAWHCTDAFIVAQATGTTWFVGSEYPLSSLLRAAKYYNYGQLNKGAAMRAMLDALAATVKRGFYGYVDFKDQLDAIDLGLVPEDMQQVGAGALLELFEQLDRGERG